MFVFNLKVMSRYREGGRCLSIIHWQLECFPRWYALGFLSVLLSFSKAVESLAQGGDAEVQHRKEAQKKMQEMEEMLTGRINLLEEVSDHCWRDNKESLLSLYCYLRLDTVINLYLHNVFFHSSLSLLETVYSCIYCWVLVNLQRNCSVKGRDPQGWLKSI